MIYYKILYWTSILPLADVVDVDADVRKTQSMKLSKKNFMIYSMILHWTRTLPSHSGTRLESSDSSS